MNLAQFKVRANKKDYNSNNAWGFGGYGGKIYQLGDMEFRDLKRYYRHSGSSDAKSYYIATKEVTKAEFETTLNTLV